MGLYQSILNPFTGKLQLVPSVFAVTFKEYVPDYASLPMSGNSVNDARLTADNGYLYIWNGTAWISQGDFVTLSWDDILNKPTSSVSDIDDAVNKKHTQNSDTKLAEGTANEVTASELVTLKDETVPAKADKVDTIDASFGLMLHGNTDLSDSSINNCPFVNSGVSIDSVNKVFGAGSLKFDNDNDQVTYTIPSYGLLSSMSGLTIGFRYYTQDPPNIAQRQILTYAGLRVLVNHNGSNITTLWFNLNGAGGLYTSPLAINTWYAILLVWEPTGGYGTWKLYVDGILVYTEVANWAMDTVLGSSITIGKGSQISAYANIDEFYIKPNVVEYSSNYTVPVSELVLSSYPETKLPNFDASGNLSLSNTLITDVNDAISKKHAQGTDQTLDAGGANEVSASEVKQAVDDSHTHTNQADLDNVSGTNTGDQDASSVPTSDSGVSVQDALNNKADKTNVLELNNTTPFTPDADYEPATKKYVDDNAGGATAVELAFTNVDLVAGILTVTHNAGLSAGYGVIARVIDNNNKVIEPDDYLNFSANSFQVDLTSFGTISGTWYVIYITK